jgi:hypothetical protein
MNQENKKQAIIAGALGVVLVVVLFYQFVIKGTSPPTAPSGGSGGTTTVASTAAPAAGKKPLVPTRLNKVDIDLDELNEKVETVKFRYEVARISRSPMTPLVGRIKAGNIDLTAISPINRAEIEEKSVTSIIYNEYAPLAVIDDEVVSEGHQYAGDVVLIKIEPKRVWFTWGDTEIPVELKEL